MKNKKICIIGLGYVGLPLAHAFSEKYSVVGFDINNIRINELKKGYDRTCELNETQVKDALKNNIHFTNELDDISDCNVYIVTVPTPIDKHKKPNLTPLMKASEIVGKILKIDDIVIYESTVYPGATEEDCVPILEKFSGLDYISTETLKNNSKFKIQNSKSSPKGFYCGYSPERINPGDKEHTVTQIKKVTSGSTENIAKEIDNLYASIISAGTHLAPSIKVAEAAKVIENSQRDINIAFVNELSMIFNKLEINTIDVLEAAGTKWNFLPFRPGLVGGHCIGVDPYYLTHKAESVGYHPEIILAGRRLNDNMGKYVASQVVKLLIQKKCNVYDAKVLVLGITFKENCPDIRNSRVIDVVNELKEFGCNVEISDYLANPEEVQIEYNITLKQNSELKYDNYDAIVLAVPHDDYKKLTFTNTSQIIYDIKSTLKIKDGAL